MPGQHVERALQVPEIAFERHDPRHRCAHEVPVAVVDVVGHPFAAFAESPQVGCEHDVTQRGERVRVVVALATRLHAAEHALARPVAVDREHRGAWGLLAPFVRHEQIRGSRHRALGVEDNPFTRVRATFNRLGGLYLQRYARGARAQHCIESLAHACSPRRELGIERIDRARIARYDLVELQTPIRPVREVAPAAHAPSVQPRPPETWRRYTGDSHADGKCPRLVENTRPRPSVKHHASG